jgi:cell filamentation protein
MTTISSAGGGRVQWRWQEKDFGFRFRSGGGKREAEYYQANRPGEFYVVPKSQRKLEKDHADELAKTTAAPTSPLVVVNPWQSYARDWDWITTTEGLLLNYAGCLDRDEINRREDEGVSRAMELVSSLVLREPASLSIQLLCQLHSELMGAIYPFAGQWRVVALHKGSDDEPTKWVLPPCGIQPQMELFERDVLSRSPLISDDDSEVFAYASEVMNEMLAIHPFREGNGRTAFITANLILMQNDLLPLDVYERRTDEARYLSACEKGRIHKNYEPLAALLAEWADRALERWEENHG